MQEKLRFLGLDVHAETIAAAIAEPDGERDAWERFRTARSRIHKLVKKLGGRQDESLL